MSPRISPEASIGGALRLAKKNGRAAFVPYLTAGDPSLRWTERFFKALVRGGAGAVELGVPFSDPVADGVTNQRAAERALKSGTNINAIFKLCRRLRNQAATPIILFTYYNPLLRMGLKRFAQSARRAGVTGVLAVDLPPEEAGEYLRCLKSAGLEAVFLASPTTTPARLRTIARASGSAVYYVCRIGVTGVRDSLSKTLGGEIRQLRRHVSKPLLVGFGISTPAQARQAGKFADGVVVGSALMKIIEENPPAAAERKLLKFAQQATAAPRRVTVAGKRRRPLSQNQVEGTRRSAK